MLYITQYGWKIAKSGISNFQNDKPWSSNLTTQFIQMGVYFTRDGDNLFGFSAHILFSKTRKNTRTNSSPHETAMKKPQAAHLIFRWQPMVLVLPLDRGLILQIGKIKNKQTQDKNALLW